jgi:hypothetical protein
MDDAAVLVVLTKWPVLPLPPGPPGVALRADWCRRWQPATRQGAREPAARPLTSAAAPSPALAPARAPRSGNGAVPEVACLDCGAPIPQRGGRGRPARFCSSRCQGRARRKRERAPVADAGLVDPSEPERPFDSYLGDEPVEIRETLRPPMLAIEQPRAERIPIEPRPWRDLETIVRSPEMFAAEG